MRLVRTAIDVAINFFEALASAVILTVILFYPILAVRERLDIIAAFEAGQAQAIGQC